MDWGRDHGSLTPVDEVEVFCRKAELTRRQSSSGENRKISGRLQG